MSALHPEKDVHINGCGCIEANEDNGGEAGYNNNEQTMGEDEFVEDVVNDVSRFLDDCTKARDHIKKLLEGLSRFSQNETLQRIRHQNISVLSELVFNDVLTSRNNIEVDADASASLSRMANDESFMQPDEVIPKSTRSSRVKTLVKKFSLVPTKNSPSLIKKPTKNKKHEVDEVIFPKLRRSCRAQTQAKKFSSLSTKNSLSPIKKATKKKKHISWAKNFCKVFFFEKEGGGARKLTKKRK